MNHFLGKIKTIFVNHFLGKIKSNFLKVRRSLLSYVLQDVRVRDCKTTPALLCCRCGNLYRCGGLEANPLLPNPTSALPVFLWCDLLLTESYHTLAVSTIPILPISAKS